MVLNFSASVFSLLAFADPIVRTITDTSIKAKWYKPKNVTSFDFIDLFMLSQKYLVIGAFYVK